MSDFNRQIKPFGDVFTAYELSQMTLPEVNWIVPDLISEGLTMLVGKPKMGKSWLALSLCEAIATGGKVFGKIDVDQGQVLYLALEDQKRRLQSRLRQIQSEMPKNLYFANSWKNLTEGGLDHLKSWVKRNPDTRLITIDTAVKVINGRANKATLYESDYEKLTPLQEFANEKRLGIVIVHHMRKMTSDDPFDMISGSTGLLGAVDGAMAIVRERGNSKATLAVLTREGEDQELAIEFDKRIMNWVVMGTADEYRISEERKGIIDIISDFEKGISLKELSNLLQKPYKTVQKLALLMFRDGQLEKQNDKYFVRNNDEKLPFS